MFKSLMFAGFIGLAAVASSFTNQFSNQSDEGLEIGKKAPLMEYNMFNIDGTKHSLKSLMQKRGLIVVFSCNTCPFVVGSESFEGWEKQYNALKERASALGYGFVLINSNQAKRDGDDSMEQMQSHAKDMGYTMPYLVDENSQLADAFGAKTTPHVYVLNVKEELIYSGAIDNSVDSKRKSDEHYLLDALANDSSGEKIKLNNTPPRGCSIKRVVVKN